MSGKENENLSDVSADSVNSCETCEGFWSPSGSSDNAGGAKSPTPPPMRSSPIPWADELIKKKLLKRHIRALKKDVYAAKKTVQKLSAKGGAHGCRDNDDHVHPRPKVHPIKGNGITNPRHR